MVHLVEDNINNYKTSSYPYNYRNISICTVLTKIISNRAGEQAVCTRAAKINIVISLIFRSFILIQTFLLRKDGQPNVIIVENGGLFRVGESIIHHDSRLIFIPQFMKYSAWPITEIEFSLLMALWHGYMKRLMSLAWDFSIFIVSFAQRTAIRMFGDKERKFI